MAHLRQHGLQPQNIAIIPAAAGGPKGLILQALDQWLFGEWLPGAPRERSLIGASIGAWRMAAASHSDPVAAFQRLGDLYCGQSYPDRPDAHQVSTAVIELLQNFIGGHEREILDQPLHHLHLITTRGRGLLHTPRNSASAKAGFALAGIANLAGRPALARHMERVIIGDARDPLPWLKEKFDQFNTHFCALTQDNLASALLASGTLPLIMEPVRHIPQIPAGTYWDGGIIDYHLALPYCRVKQNCGVNESSARYGDGDGDNKLEEKAENQHGKQQELVLYPHFTDQIVPGWMDKPFPWRRAGRGANRHWVDNVIMVSPSPAFLRTLPRGKLPDRKDFAHHGTNHSARIRQWKQAIAESARLRDAFAAFVDRPDLAQVQPLNF